MNVEFTQRTGLTYLISNKAKTIVKHTTDEYEAYMIKAQMTNIFEEEFTIKEIV